MYCHIIGLWNDQGRKDEKCTSGVWQQSMPPNASGRYVLLAQAAYLLCPPNYAPELEPSFFAVAFHAFSYLNTRHDMRT